ncbi:hypothetical protein HAX54_045105 [Datura stramonium]|uniref:Phosphoribosyltransferase domain-containing protein n=1 Tax=Datura stramonium TaxID=4076 RepID=A0ABS8SQN2_DATST|nr:hypothetical protein [Datura stramonium]
MILFTEQQISQRASELASQITLNFSPNPTMEGLYFLLLFIGSGRCRRCHSCFSLFLADLARQNQASHSSVDFCLVESYGPGTVSSGKPKISLGDLKIDVTGKHVSLVEDIVDTGNTLSCLIGHLKSKGASSISVVL